MLNQSIRSYFYEFYGKKISGRLFRKRLKQFQSCSAVTKLNSCKMFMPFYYYRNSKCLRKAASRAEKDLNLALIGYCGYFHFSSWQLELLFCGQFTEALWYSADTSRAQSCQTLVLTYLCKLAGQLICIKSFHASKLDM